MHEGYAKLTKKTGDGRIRIDQLLFKAINMTTHKYVCGLYHFNVEYF